MRDEFTDTTDWKNRFFYGAVVGAILGMIIGSMPCNEPIIGLFGLFTGAALIGALSACSNNFWESLRAAWELVRVSFWRW